MTYTTIAKVVKTVGLQGELKLYPYSDFIHHYLKVGASLVLWNETKDTRMEVVIRHVRPQGATYLVQFKNYLDRQQVEPLLNQFVQIPHQDLAPLKKNQFRFPDLMDCQVIDSQGHVQGTVGAILNAGAQPLLRVIRPGQSDVLIPFVDVFIHSVDIPQKRIVIHEIAGLFS